MRSTSITDESSRAKCLCHRVTGHKRKHLFRFIYSHAHRTIDTVQIVHHSICALKLLFFDVDVELWVHSLTKSCITLVERTEEFHWHYCAKLMNVGGDIFMINVRRSISFTTQMLQNNEDERSTQYYVIDEPRPAASYPDFISIDCPHETFTFLNKYISKCGHIT
jgi:hypothetical protein